VRGLLVWVCLFTACGDGVSVEIHVPDGVDSVELFVAEKDALCRIGGRDCPGIAPPTSMLNQSRQPIDGTVFDVDDIAPNSVTVEDGIAVFSFQAADVEIGAAIAVGHGATGQPIGVALIDGFDLGAGAQKVVAVMTPSTGTLDTADPAVEEWSAPDGAYTCVGARVDGATVFIVPEADPDCDQVAGRECAPLQYLGSNPPATELDRLTCATQSTNTPCRLGDRVCDETRPDPGTDLPCVTPATDFCVPDVACTCGDDLASCVDQLLDQNGDTATQIYCTISTKLLGNVNTMCPQGPTPIHLGGMTACTAVSIMPFVADFTQLSNQLQIGTSQNGFTIKPAISATCDFSFLVPDPTMFDNSFIKQHAAIVEVAVESANPDGTFVLLPLVVELQANDCTEPSACTIVKAPNEKVFTCFDL